MLSNPKIRLPDDRQPSVIDTDVICTALRAEKDNAADSADVSEEGKEFMLRTTTTLRLEFRQILRVENLGCLTALTRLFLDNNFIEVISGLDPLVHLKWLDLSFNKIRRIQGLECLKKLEVLALYANQISSLENLDHLTALSVLRVGQNALSDRADVVYLRKLCALRTLSMKGNPVCDEPDFEGFVLAMLPDLCYLECHFVSSERHEAAVQRHQGDLFRVRNAEARQREEQQLRQLQLAHQRRHRAALVADLRGEQLLAALLRRDENAQRQLVARLRMDADDGRDGARRDFCRDMTTIGDQIYELGLKELDDREAEVRLFEEAVHTAQKESQRKGVADIEGYLGEKERIFDALFEIAARLEDKDAEEVTELQREEVDKIKEEFSTMTKETWNKVMEHEIILINQLEQVLLSFEANITSMMSSFADSVSALLATAKVIEERYFMHLVSMGEMLEEKPFKESAMVENETERCETRISALITRCHDSHQEVFVEQEIRLQEAIDKWKREFMEDFRKKERKRNRDRVVELNHFFDTMRQEEDELDILPAIQFNINEDILVD